MRRNTVILLLIVAVVIVISSARRYRGYKRNDHFKPGRRSTNWRRKHVQRNQRDHWNLDFTGTRHSPHIQEKPPSLDPLFGINTDLWDDRLDGLLTSFRNRRYNFNFNDRFWFDFGWNTQRKLKQWWEGPNVCKDAEETMENTTIADNGPISSHLIMRSQVCDETETSYKCTTKSGVFLGKKTVVEVFECCHGFTRKKGMFGCPTEFKLETLVQTAEDLGLREFLRAVESVSLTDTLEKGNFTVFAPVNKAFENKDIIPDYGTRLMKDMPNIVMVSKPITNLVIADMTNLLLGHLVYNTLKTSNLNDEQLIETASPYNSELRINFYSQPEKLITVNCARILSADNQATNGIIHTIDRVIQPVTQTIIDVISKNPKMSFLKTALAKADLVRPLRADGQYTLFAPTDAAFEKLEPGLKERLLHGNKACLEKVLKNHLLPNVICSTVIQGQTSSPNILKTSMNLTRTKDDKLFVENSQMVVRDIMTTNGVIHVIEDVLIPNDALGLLDVAKKIDLTEFINLLNKTGIIKDIKKMENVTVFIPTNEAIKKLEEEDPKKLREILMYHVVPDVVNCNRLHNNYELYTKVKDKKIRINGYSSFPFGLHSTQTAQCAPVISQNIPACGGVINIVDQVLIPPSGNVIDVLSSKKEFSFMLQLLKKSGLADMLQEAGPFTLFAPTNKAFEHVDVNLKYLEDHRETLISVLKNHIVQEFICCASVRRSRTWNVESRVYALSRASFSFRERRGHMEYGDANIEECDTTATNGVVHTIDRIISNERRFDSHISPMERWFRELGF